MSNLWSDDDDTNTSNNDSGKDPVRAQLRKMEKENTELKTKLDEALKAQRTSTIKDVLAEKKLNPKLARLIPADVQATPDAIDAWLKDYEDLFPKTDTTTNSTDNGNPDTGSVDDATDEAKIAAMNAAMRINLATSQGKAPDSKPEELYKKLLSPDLKPEELMKMIETAGGGLGVG